MLTNGPMNGALPALDALREEPDVDEEIAWLQTKLAQREARQREIHNFLLVAQQQLRKTELEVVRLQRALATLLEGPPPAISLPDGPLRPLGQGSHPHPGMGPGYRAGRYLLEVLQQRPDGMFTVKEAHLACKGWRETTINDGLRRLVTDGLVERPQRGHYRLTDKGRQEGPADTLPLQEPEEVQEATA